MTYSIIGILAIAILVISNRDIIWNGNERENTVALRSYRHFLFGILLYYITDSLWGILDEAQMVNAVYADTVIHFIAMALAVMLWTEYVISYLEGSPVFDRVLFLAGRIFPVLVVIALSINFFYPVVFSFDDDGTYHAHIARYIILVVQILLFFLTSLYTLQITYKSQGRVRRRNLTIGLFGTAMMILVLIQVFYPLWPFYSMGYMLGTCLLHSFVVEDEREEYRRELEEALKREHLQKEELAHNRESLKDALAQAENANNAKTAFLSNMSHEIRTPMNAIIGLNNIAMNDPSASEKMKEYLKKTSESAHHLLDIINDILDMSRIESGRMVIKEEDFSLPEALEQVNTIINGQCNEKGLSYDSVIEGSIDDYYIGDAIKLKQVLINILGNAVKFTPEGGSITFTVKETARYEGKVTLRFTVSDTGIGINEDFLPKIFETFSQEDRAAESRYGSTGLGMPITKSIVELMNGTIEVTSERNRGSTFVVTVTLGESDKKACDKPEKESDPKEDVQVDLADSRILLAEDVDINADVIITILGMRDINVERASNGKEAVEMFESHEPGYYDAILMDMWMPEMDGLEATKHIRALSREDARTLPIIALTANAYDEDVKRSMQAGLNAHLSKPVEPQELFDTLEELKRR